LTKRKRRETFSRPQSIDLPFGSVTRVPFESRYIVEAIEA